MEDPFAALFGALDLVPAPAHDAGARDLGRAEDVGVPRHELRVNSAGDSFQISCSTLLQQQCEEVDLEQEVPELVEELGIVARLRCVGDLIGLLDGVRHDRARRLLAIPRALAAQPLGQLLQLDERVGERHL